MLGLIGHDVYQLIRWAFAFCSPAVFLGSDGAECWCQELEVHACLCGFTAELLSILLLVLLSFDFSAFGILAASGHFKFCSSSFVAVVD